MVGANAAKIAAGFQADIAILDVNMDRLRYLDDIMPPNVNCLYSDRHTIRHELRLADLVIGAVLIPGAVAPKLVTREMVAGMKEGSVIADVAIDQGGCVETARPTTHSDPVYTVDGVTHYVRGVSGLSDTWVALHTRVDHHDHDVQVFVPYVTIFRVSIHPAEDERRGSMGFLADLASRNERAAHESAAAKEIEAPAARAKAPRAKPARAR